MMIDYETMSGADNMIVENDELGYYLNVDEIDEESTPWTCYICGSFQSPGSDMWERAYISTEAGGDGISEGIVCRRCKEKESVVDAL